MKYVELEKDYVVRSEREFKSKLNKFSKEIAKRLNQDVENWNELFSSYYQNAKETKEQYDIKKADENCFNPGNEYDYENQENWSYCNRYDNGKWTGWEGSNDENGKIQSISWDYYPADEIGSGRLYLYVKQRVED